MSKNVLIISASPRRGGNSDALCDQFLAGAQAAGHKVEKVFLRDHQINYCMGCGVCNSSHKCVQQDDMAPLIDKMLAADVLVLSTPVYFYSMDAQLKTFIDRCVPRYTDMSGKEVYFIISAADNSKKNMTSTLEALRGFTRDCLEGTIEKGVLYGIGAWKTGEVKSLPVYQEAYEAGKNC